MVVMVMVQYEIEITHVWRAVHDCGETMTTKNVLVSNAIVVDEDLIFRTRCFYPAQTGDKKHRARSTVVGSLNSFSPDGEIVVRDRRHSHCDIAGRAINTRTTVRQL